MKYVWIFAAILFTSLASVSYSAEVPELKHRINDYANVLTETQEQEIEKTLEKFNSLNKSPEMAVLLIESLEGDNIDEYTNKVFNTWGIGKKG